VLAYIRKAIPIVATKYPPCENALLNFVRIKGTALNESED
jgi:hypothetical protein